MFSLRWAVWANITSLNPLLFIEMHVPSHESEGLCICVLGYRFLRYFDWILEQCR